MAGAAIWPGAHEGSTIQRMQREDRARSLPVLDLQRYLRGLENDLEAMPPEVVLGRVRRFLTVDLREVLREDDWRRLPWYIDSRCSGCDYLGYRWSRHEDSDAETGVARGAPPDVRYCWPTAERTGHLSRITGLTEGASGRLCEAEVDSVQAVSMLSAGSPAFERHQTLRAKRTVLSARATTLQNQTPADIPDRAGTSAILPRFADIRVAVSADFDVGSGLTFALGYRLSYGIPTAARPLAQPGARFERSSHRIERPILVLDRTLVAEGEMLRTWLTHLVNDILYARGRILAGYRANGSPGKRDATIQFYLWDRLTFNHLCRVLGRHLDRVQAPVIAGATNLNPMAWIFPSEGVLDEPDFVSRSSPITIVSDAVNSLVTAPIPHHYGAVDLANILEPETRVLPDGRPWGFHVSKFYRDPLSDQIPSERGHEVWERISPFPNQDFQWHQEQVRHVVKRKLHAISYVAGKLTSLLGANLAAEAPGVDNVFVPNPRLNGVGDDGQILYQHTRLMAAAQQLEIDLLMAMPPHEREARFKSVRVETLLTGDARLSALTALDLAGQASDGSVLVFQLSERSREARLKDGEYTWSFLPEADLPALQELTVAQFKARHPALERQMPTEQWEFRAKLRDVLTVTILKMDRGQRILIVRAGALLAAAIQLGLLHMDIDGSNRRFGILDPVALDLFTRKLKKTLEDRSGIRNPPLAQQRPLFPALGVARVPSGRPHMRPANGPAAQFIWDADVMARTATTEDAAAIIAAAERVTTPGLTTMQRNAIEQAASRRLALWWGPPGTGKSRTARAYITALAARAVAEARPVRIAIVGFTWVAIDEVARRLPGLLEQAGLAESVCLARLSTNASPTGVAAELRDHLVSMEEGGLGRTELERRLSDSNGVTIVASTVDQLHKLRRATVCSPLFDVMLIDEASQLDVAHAVVGLSKLADDGRVVVIGDDKQMAPIHPLEAPEGLEHLLGSVYDFFRCYRRHEGADFAVNPIMLDRSFRSNQEIVEFVREAGYGETLQADASKAGLRISTAVPIPQALPTTWPAQLPWSPNFAAILSPDEPLAAVVHQDRYSSQRNDQEADLAAGLVLTLYQAGLHDLDAGDGRPYTPNDLFDRGVGIVTPHRAQQAAIFERLSAVLPPEVNRNIVFASIDTVERFQGQEKAVILTSFGLGDADQIAAEEEFLFSLNRFNVAASRAQAKFIAIISRRLVDHLPSDRRALEESRLLKYFIDGFLTRTVPLTLPGLGFCELKLR